MGHTVKIKSDFLGTTTLLTNLGKSQNNGF